MPKMDKKQKKEMKRAQKAKKLRMNKVEEAQAQGHISEEQKKSGTLQLYVFLTVAIVGALFIVLNV